MSEPQWMVNEAHPSLELLLLHVESELEGKIAFAVEQHVKDCWMCRTSCEHLQQGIFTFMEFYAEKQLPEHSGSRHRLSRRLQELAEGSGSATANVPATFSDILHGYRRRFFIPTMITVSLFCAAVVLLLVRSIAPTQSVSASELLQRAQTSEISSLRASGAAVIYQKVRISTPRRTVERELYRDAEGRRRPKPQLVTAEISPIKGELEMAGVNWDAPLSAASFQNWHDRQEPKTDKVWRTGTNLVTLTTTVEDGPVSNESFTVRENDFHPVKRTIQTKDNGAFQIEEVNYMALSWNNVNQALFEPIEPAPSSIVASAPAAPSIASVHHVLPTLLQLDDAEMAARFALHRFGADLDPIHIDVDAQQEPSAVMIQGVVSSDERKQELLQSLSKVPYVKTHLQTVEDAVSQNAPGAGESAITSGSNNVELHSPIEKQLREYFNSPEALEDFSKRALAGVDSLVTDAAALRHLDERYPGLKPTISLPLSSASCELLDAMVRDHRNAMRDETTALEKLLKPILLTIASPTADAPEELPILDRAHRIEQLTLYLLFGNALTDANIQASDPDQAARELLMELQQLESQTQSQE